MSPEKAVPVAAGQVIRLRFPMPGFGLKSRAVVQVGKGKKKIPLFVAKAWVKAGIASEGKQLP